MVDIIFLFGKIIIAAILILVVAIVILGYLNKKSSDDTKAKDAMHKRQFENAYIKCPVCEVSTLIKSIECNNCNNVGTLSPNDLTSIDGWVLNSSMTMRCKKCQHYPTINKCPNCNKLVNAHHLKIPGGRHSY
jgi:hypothetical protein